MTDQVGEPSKTISIQDFGDKMFKSFTGVPKNFFNCLAFLLQDLVHPSKKLSREHKLLIFFLKIKLSLTYTIISGLFDITQHSTSKFFKEVLGALYQISKDHLPRLDRETINSN